MWYTFTWCLCNLLTGGESTIHDMAMPTQAAAMMAETKKGLEDKEKRKERELFAIYGEEN